MVLKHVTIDGIRLHLKLDENRMLINGYYTVYLNNTAREMLDMFIECCKIPGEEKRIIEHTLDAIQVRYPKLPRADADRDLKKLIEIINYFAKGQIPSHLVGLDEFPEPNVPQRMDLALTYRCTNKCPHCYLPKNESAVEMTTDQWKKVIQKLWRIGVPQVAFTGGECTIRDDLPELIKSAEEMITGVITNGVLITPGLAKEMKDAELDWIQITLESPKKEVHDEMQGRVGAFEQTVEGIKNAVAAGLSVSINATLTKKNYQDLPDLIRFAKQLGVKFVASNAIINSGRGATVKSTEGISEKELLETLTYAKEVAKVEGIEFNWFLPTCYKNLDPTKLGFGQRSCSACGVNMMIEPDGTLIPCQSWTNLKMGNFLMTEWQSVWNSEIAKKIRAHGFAPQECQGCDQFKQCGGGCPLEHLNGGK